MEMAFFEIGNPDDKWEMDTQAYTETYTKKITLAGKGGEEFTYKLWLIAEDETCRKCGGVRFRYYVEIWDFQNGWLHLPAYDDNYYCSNECEEEGLKPIEFEKLFRKIQKGAENINLE